MDYRYALDYIMHGYIHNITKKLAYGINSDALRASISEMIACNRKLANSVFKKEHKTFHYYNESDPATVLLLWSPWVGIFLEPARKGEQLLCEKDCLL